MSKKRQDVELVELGLARSRSHAQQLIKDGLINFDGEKYTLHPHAKYVSRGAIKLLNALDFCQLPIKNKNCLDIGVSTGGFSQVLLERGASHVTGVDVGTDQTALEILHDPRFDLIEKLNARELRPDHFGAKCFDLIVLDLSFISIRLVIGQLKPLLRAHGEVLALIKPQFELGKEALNKKGVVKDPSLYERLREQVTAWFVSAGFEVKAYFPSSIKGGDGNAEYFCYAQRIETP